MTDPAQEGTWAQQAEGQLPLLRHDEEIERGLAFGLSGSPTLTDRTIPTFSREVAVEVSRAPRPDKDCVVAVGR